MIADGLSSEDEESISSVVRGLIVSGKLNDPPHDRPLPRAARGRPGVHHVSVILREPVGVVMESTKGIELEVNSHIPLYLGEILEIAFPIGNALAIVRSLRKTEEKTRVFFDWL